ncbi:hypothetical protein LCGC14_1321850 [marine sediment metagenome]|uniref:Uncharacterized protein n=1 Tax=marine sediment metagenome TaxID=412755 RepID=A0A0F9KJ99_9ZZZZ
MKRKVFKRQIDLIRCAIKNVLDRQLAQLREQREKALTHLKKTNFLEWTKYKSGESTK